MNTATYAGRKRKKPQKSAKQRPADSVNVVVKSNPSKRHRERLNGELERLAALLPFPQDVISKLDKLTVLRLSVSYLRAKSHFNATVKSRSIPQIEGNGVTDNGLQIPEGELLLQVLNGFVLVVTAAGTIFYASSTIQDYLGYPQSDVIHMSVYDFIHAEDRAEFQRHLHWAMRPAPHSSDTAGEDSRDLQRYCSSAAGEDSRDLQRYCSPEQLPPEDSTFLQRNFVCRFRCLLDCSSGFLALNFVGRLKFLHGQNEKDEQGKPVPPQLALFAMATPLQPLSILEIRTKNYFFKTKHKLDFTPTATDSKGRVVMGYTDAEFCSRGSGYQFVHAGDMLHCSEHHMRMMKTGESGMTVFRLLTKNNGWVWVQSNARLVYKNQRPDFIICSERVLTDEEGEEHRKKRSAHVLFSYTTGEAVLYDSDFPGASAGSSPNSTTTNNNNNQEVDTLNPASLLGSLMIQDRKSIYPCHASHGAAPAPNPAPRVFSSSWQESFLPLSENSVFSFEAPQPRPVVEEDAELWSFMRSLGICREDLELFQQDETFLNVELDDRDAVPDFTEEILSYVQDSLRKRTDGTLSGNADRLGGQDLGGCSSLILEYRASFHQQPQEQQQSARRLTSCWEEQQAELPQLQPQSRLLPQCMQQSLPESMPQCMQQSMPQCMQQSMPQCMPQSMQQSMPQSMQQSLPQSMQQSLPQSMQQSMPLSMQQSMPQCMQQSIPQSMQQSMPQCMQQSLPQSMQQSLPQSMQQSLPQSMQQSLPQSMQQSLQPSMPQPFPQCLQQSIPQSFPQSQQQSLLQSMPQSMPQSVQQSLPQSLEQSMPQSLQQSIPQSFPQALPQSCQYQQQAHIQQQPSHPQTLAPTTVHHQLHGQAQPLTPQQHQPPYGQPCQQQQQQQHVFPLSQPVQCTQQQQQQLCYVPKPCQAAVNNSYDFVSQGGGSSSQHVATLFHMDQTGLRRDGQHPAYVHPGQASQGLLNAGSTACMQALNCLPAGQSASGMASGSAEAQQNGNGPPLAWNMDTAVLYQQQQQLPADTQTTGKAFAMHVNTTDQPHAMQFQSGGRGNAAGPAGARNGTSGRPEQQPPQNLRLGRDAV